MGFSCITKSSPATVGGHFKGAFLPLMFMEATSSHGFDADQAKSRRRAVYGKLAEVTVNAGSYEAKLSLSEQDMRWTERWNGCRRHPVTGSSGYMFARDNPRNKKRKDCLSS